jgi:hypothetical protein
MTCRSPISAAARAQISADTKARMADPAVRARISERTKAGMAAASGKLADLRMLRDVWHRARPEARLLFLNEVFAAASSASSATMCSERRE